MVVVVVVVQDRSVRSTVGERRPSPYYILHTRVIISPLTYIGGFFSFLSISLLSLLFFSRYFTLPVVILLHLVFFTRARRTHRPAPFTFGKRCTPDKRHIVRGRIAATMHVTRTISAALLLGATGMWCFFFRFYRPFSLVRTVLAVGRYDLRLLRKPDGV